jgi:hypothetical protein
MVLTEKPSKHLLGEIRILAKLMMELAVQKTIAQIEKTIDDKLETLKQFWKAYCTINGEFYPKYYESKIKSDEQVLLLEDLKSELKKLEV